MVGKKIYLRRAFNTFCPRFIFKILDFFRGLVRKQVREHWRMQDFSDRHGYDKYDYPQEKLDVILSKTIRELASSNESILDLGCNTGRQLRGLNEIGYKRLTGLDISPNAIKQAKIKPDSSGIEFIEGSFEKKLPEFVLKNRKFDLIYSAGAGICLVYPAFDVVKYICKLSRKYAVLVNQHNNGYPRIWEYEFERWGFKIIKFLRTVDGKDFTTSANETFSLAIYCKIS